MSLFRKCLPCHRIHVIVSSLPLRPIDLGKQQRRNLPAAAFSLLHSPTGEIFVLISPPIRAFQSLKKHTATVRARFEVCVRGCPAAGQPCFGRDHLERPPNPIMDHGSWIWITDHGSRSTNFITGTCTSDNRWFAMLTVKTAPVKKLQNKLSAHVLQPKFEFLAWFGNTISINGQSTEECILVAKYLMLKNLLGNHV